MRTTPEAASLFGVDGGRLLAATLALAGAMAGLSGMLIVAQYGGLGFAGGFQFGLKALIAAIVGGIGSVPGALLGGMAVGLFETLWSAYLPIDARDIALYAALVVFLVFRPGGFLGIQGADAAAGVSARRTVSWRGASALRDRLSRTSAGGRDDQRAGAAHPARSGPAPVQLTGATVFVKHENMQPTGSFKERGALTKLESLRAGRAAGAASSPCRPATTPRRSPTTPSASASRRPS